MKMLKRFVLIVLLVISLSACKNNKEAEELYSMNLNSIVELKVEYFDNTSYATAVCIDKDGGFITNAHVIPDILDDEINLFIRFSTSEDYEKINLTKLDRNIDLAMLKLETEKECVPLKFSKERKTGQKVYAIGNTSNQGVSISEGIITKSEVYVETKNISMNMIATDAFFAEGNSGGALVDIDNNLLGITTLRLKDNNGNIIYGVGYVIPVQIIVDFIS